MKLFDLSKFTKGWFIGNFEPSLLKTDQFEVAVKIYKKDYYEKPHHHKVSTEYTIIISGNVLINGELFKDNDIVVMEPNETTDFLCLTDVVTAVVKVPCTQNDKFID